MATSLSVDLTHIASGAILSFNMLRAITFDLWTTIVEPVDYRGPRVEYTLRLLKSKGYSFEPPALLSAYDYSLEMFRYVWQNEHRHMSSAQRLGFMMRRLGVDLCGEDLDCLVKYYEETVL